jgi:hypothetical protein
VGELKFDDPKLAPAAPGKNEPGHENGLNWFKSIARKDNPLRP